MICGLGLLGLVASGAEAALVGTISILDKPVAEPGGVGEVWVRPGETLGLYVVGTGFEDSVEAGDFTASWDPDVISYAGLSIADPPWDTQFVDDTSVGTGTLDSVFLGDSATVGKATGKDADAGKATFVSLLGLDGAKGRAQDLVQNAVDALDIYGEDAEVLRDTARFVIARKN